MALITPRTVQKQHHLVASHIPVAATHVIWFRWSEDSHSGPVTVVQYADTELSAKRAYNKAAASVGERYFWGAIASAGWATIEPDDRIHGKAL